MRVALLNHGFPPDVGGGETQAYITAATLQKHGHEVHVFTGRPARTLEFPFAVTYLNHYKAFEKGEEGPKYFVKELKDALQAAGEFDILYCSNFSALLALGYMQGIIKGKLVFTFHCVPAQEQQKVVGYFGDWELEQSFARSILRIANPSITVCPSGFFAQWATQFGVPKNKMTTIYNSVIPKDFAVKVSEQERRAWRKEQGFDPGSFVFVTPARMLPKKGIGELVRAAKAAPETARFFVVSSRRNADQEFLRETEDFIQSAGLNEKIKIVYDRYSVNEMPKLYRLCDALLLPSHFEGLPVSILEAMASKKLVVCSDIPALQEIITDNETGLMCRARSVESLSETLHRAVNLSEKQRQRLIDAAYETVTTKCDADTNMRKLEELFNSLP